MENLKNHIEARLKHANNRVDALREEHGDHPDTTHTYHGGWSLGYWQGKLTVYENILDELEALEEETK